MNDERTWLLLSLQLSGEASPEEIEELKTLLTEHPEQTIRAEVLRNLWATKNEPATASHTESAFNRHLQRLSNHLSQPVLLYEHNDAANTEQNNEEKKVVTNPGKYRGILWAASVAAAVIIVALLALNHTNNKQVLKNELAANVVTTRPGSKSKVQLPDGTQVWLNADSKISYKNNFLGDIREVTLSGEAFFDVVKDKTRPFIIHTGSIDLKVLGTAFNVRSYPNEKTTETSLIRGSVEILLHNNPDKKYILKPNEKLVVNNSITKAAGSKNQDENTGQDQQIMTLSKILFDKQDSSNIETRWTNDLLDFDGTPFANIVTELERLYKVRFIIKDEKLKQVRFTGVFSNKSLDEVMEALRISGQFQYKFKNDVVIVW
ncbi:MAG: FecR family protein [Aquabacterium sp.]|nr:FecR family protein [Ferruginibacter sp.]